MQISPVCVGRKAAKRVPAPSKVQVIDTTKATFESILSVTATWSYLGGRDIDGQDGPGPQNVTSWSQISSPSTPCRYHGPLLQMGAERNVAVRSPRQKILQSVLEPVLLLAQWLSPWRSPNIGGHG